MPAWIFEKGVFRYRVLGNWPQALWKNYKLDDQTYEKYIYLTRDGVQPRKRNLDACKAWKEAAEEEAEMQAAVKRIRSNGPIYQSFPDVPAVNEWLACFASHPFGSSASGKTEFAKSLFPCPFELKVGSSDLFPSKMVEFKRDTHDAIILADVRDLDFLVQHQEKLQGKYDSRIELATTQGGTCFYTKYLFKVPSVVTINYTTQNSPFLQFIFLAVQGSLHRPSASTWPTWPTGSSQPPWPIWAFLIQTYRDNKRTDCVSPHFWWEGCVGKTPPLVGPVAWLRQCGLPSPSRWRASPSLQQIHGGPAVCLEGTGAKFA